jgi:hypothetical protein
MLPRQPLPDLFARILGALVFLLGIFLLWSVYQSASGLFSQPAPALPTPAPTPTSSPAPGNEATAAAVFIGKDLADYLKKMLALLLMCIAGALIASMGIKAIFSPAPKSAEPTP